MDDYPIPLEVQEEMDKTTVGRDQALANSLALRSFGAIGLSDLQLADLYHMPLIEVAKFRESHKAEIATAKDYHMHGKFMMFKGAARAVAMREAMIEARLAGDNETAEKLKAILFEAEKIFPVKKMAEIASMYESLEPKSDIPNQTLNLHLHNSPELAKAKKLLAERQAKEMDI